ncbi:hypothetical protein PHLCEN_2v13356 [Hermanssonia centrifuga]|uniref:Uncharacterized protein n=1 Tax=Hermanssonia centrifuga TaxID=98765 RepID=A0A2R6NEG9_9APHY|nr:hypothetical protein PHLCEN_2v13356 [Hermanssonia centrifuga]
MADKVFQSPAGTGIRPTLPSLHTLGLLNALTLNESMESPLAESLLPRHETKSEPYRRLDNSRWQRVRQASISSTTSSCTTLTSRSISPCYSENLNSTRSSTSPPPPYVPAGSFSLILTSFEKADAFVVVPPPEAPYVPNISALSRTSASSNTPKGNAQRSPALLLVGPAVEYLRHPRLRIAKGARIHPYRVIPRHSRRRVSPSSPIPILPDA